MTTAFDFKAGILTSQVKTFLTKRRHKASTLVMTGVPLHRGIYVWSKGNSEVFYIGTATGKYGLKGRLGDHLRPTHLEARKSKHQPEDSFQLKCGIFVTCSRTGARKPAVDKSVFRRSLGRKLRLAPGVKTVGFIRSKLEVAWFTFPPKSTRKDILKYEAELIRMLKPKLNRAGNAGSLDNKKVKK